MDLQARVRNFAIIAHIDHGKSTLADRLLELTGTVSRRLMQEQMLDSNPIERERGITIKLAPVRMLWKENILNLIDTPGHVDFSYEVSRSLAACEGALLVVDATQGVQAQTLAHLHQARVHNLVIIPIINKIDLQNARICECEEELRDLGFSEEEILKVSAKTGENVEKVLETIVKRIPPPSGKTKDPTRAFIFSSQYDPHKGVVIFVRIVDGSIHFDSTLRLKFHASGATVTPIELGHFSPQMKSQISLETGEVGYIATGLKDVRLAKVGDTITCSEMSNVKFPALPAGRQISNQRNQHNTFDNIQPLPGYKEPKPMVFVGLFPVEGSDYTASREAMERLRLSDSAFTFRPISSLALGNGFHCGFLGLLHAEIVQERIYREFGLSVIATTPSVEYLIKSKTKDLRPKTDTKGYVHIQSAAEYPDPSLIEETKEPIMNVTIYCPKKYVGAVMQLSQEKRGEYVDLKYHADQAEFTYLIPFSEMIVDFFDRLKSVSEGYASLDYEFFDYQTVKVVKLDILVNKERVDALSLLVVESSAQRRGNDIVDKLATVLPRQQFNIPVQAAIGGQIIARADVKPFRKDVIQKLYGGDRTRKDKLLEAQKKGKARMKMVGKVEIPQSAFFEVLKRT